ncbi:NUDIX hydrolase [Agrobacterium sp. a22-2]|uniref:NUDIX hydrolase n=1 Tax=Agrobacterium sp. a22-2 TaxID=2283840 RepID=UPI001447698B|nr:NUDIX hydrolase [Agrobacterium sp. a22-2]NKN36306.1 NUDIX hydrolase [Agrobacterium sp. a22-2]
MTLHAIDDHLHWPPEETVFPVSKIRLRISIDDYPFTPAEQAEAADNWHRETAANPALYNGKMLFQHRLTMGGDTIAGQGHVVPYSAFLWWRRQQVPSSGYHLFGLPVPVSSDGAVIAVRMSNHTANPGQVYCPAGSLDPSDIVDGFADIAGNMAREVSEETGLALGEADADPQFYASHLRRRVTVFRLYRFALTADEMLERIAAHMAVDEEQEISGAVAIRSADPQAHPYNRAMLPMLDWYFNSLN